MKLEGRKRWALRWAGYVGPLELVLRYLCLHHQYRMASTLVLLSGSAAYSLQLDSQVDRSLLSLSSSTHHPRKAELRAVGWHSIGSLHVCPFFHRRREGEMLMMLRPMKVVGVGRIRRVVVVGGCQYRTR